MAPVMLEGDASATTDERPGRWACEPKPGAVVGLAFHGTEPPPADEHVVPNEILARFNGGEVRALAPDFVFGWIREGKRAFRFGVYADGELRRSPVTNTASNELFVASRERAFVATKGDHEVWEVSTLDGSARRVLELVDGTEVYNLGLMPGGGVLVLDDASVRVVVRDGDGGRQAARYAINANRAMFERGRVLVLEGMGDPTGLWVLAVDGDALRVLSAHDVPTDELRWYDGRIYVGVDGEWYTLTGLDEALASAGALPEPPAYDAAEA